MQYELVTRTYTRSVAKRGGRQPLYLTRLVKQTDHLFWLELYEKNRKQGWSLCCWSEIESMRVNSQPSTGRWQKWEVQKKQWLFPQAQTFLRKLTIEEQSVTIAKETCLMPCCSKCSKLTSSGLSTSRWCGRGHRMDLVPHQNAEPVPAMKAQQIQI